jgi:hypothetical protein
VPNLHKSPSWAMMCCYCRIFCAPIIAMLQERREGRVSEKGGGRSALMVARDVLRIRDPLLLWRREVSFRSGHVIDPSACKSTVGVSDMITQVVSLQKNTCLPGRQRAYAAVYLIERGRRQLPNPGGRCEALLRLVTGRPCHRPQNQRTPSSCGVHLPMRADFTTSIPRIESFCVFSLEGPLPYEIIIVS